MPTFSIVIPAYQAADSIGRAVESALAQTVPPHQVVVCDDGSTDAIDEALAPWRDSLLVIRKENGGGASALNTAVRAASGTFVAVLDADDVYHPRRIEALGGLAEARPDLDILTTDAYLEVDGRIGGRFSDETPFEAKDQRAGILRACFVGGWPAVRRATLLVAGGFDESLRIAYDWDCWLRLIFSGARAGCVSEPLLTYRIRPGSLSSNRSASLRERITVLESAAARESLTRVEHAVVAGTLRRERRRLAAAETAGGSVWTRLRGRRRGP